MPRRNADCNPLELAYALLIKLPGVDPKTIEECPSWLHCPKFPQFRANLLTQGNLQPLINRFNTLRSPEWENCVRVIACLLYTSPSPRDRQKSRMPSSA